MYLRTLITALLLSVITIGLAQTPPPCGSAADDPPGCFLCSPVFVGSNQGATPGNTPGNFCGVIHNNVWISFIACSTTISFNVSPTSCQTGEGIQVVVTDSNLNPVSNCCSPPPNMVNCSVTATGLTPGEIYYVMIDGSTGDVCDFVLTATGGFCFGQPDAPGPITMDPNYSPICPGAEMTFSVGSITNATSYEWSLPPGARIINGAGTNEITVVFDDPTVGVVCVSGVNPCFTGPPACLPVLVQNIPPTIIPPRYYCLEDFPVVLNGRNFPSPGTFQITYSSFLGCDSVVSYSLLQHPRLLNIINATICEGDCYLVGSQYYCQDREYNIVLPEASVDGCDSFITLRLDVLTPVADIADPGPLPCTSNPSLILDGTGSSSNGTYNWTAQNGGNIVSGQGTQTVNVNREGRYILEVTVTDGFGLYCTEFDTVDVVRQVIPLDTISFIRAPVDLCEGIPVTYTLDPVPGATNYHWSVTTGAVLGGSGTSVAVNWDTLTTGQICVYASSACGTSPDTCLDVTINPLPENYFDLPDSICTNQDAVIVYSGNAPDTSSFFWNFNGGQPDTVSGPGPHNISWTTAGPRNVSLRVEDETCLSEVLNQEILVQEPLQEPTINCITDWTEITFTWDPVAGATSYEIIVDGQNQGFQTDTFFYIDNLIPDQLVTITVRAIGNNACGASSSSQLCQAQNCPVVDLLIDPIPNICRDVNPGIIQMTYNQTGGTGNGNAIWRGPGTSVTGQFDPTQANIGPNTVNLTYSEGTCLYSEDIVIMVNEAPTAGFLLDSIICVNDRAPITYSGNATSNANYSWDFDGGTITSGMNQGPFQIAWSNPGRKQISLMVEENGCPSLLFADSILVVDSLENPVVNCVPSTNEVVFEWPAVPNATDYQVNLINGQSGTLSGTSYIVDGISANDTITIELLAIGDNICGPSSTMATCVAEDCPAVNFELPVVGPLCDNGMADTMRLAANVLGGNGSGTLTWSGPGVAPDGSFNPNAPSVNPPSANIRIAYQEGNCLYDSVFQLVVNRQPTADFTFDNTICESDSLLVEYTGNGTPGATYDWQFENGQILSGSGQGPYTISFDSIGNQNIILQVTENNCSSETDTLNVSVDPALGYPMVSCNSNSEEIQFTWPGVLGADYYEVNVLSGHSGSLNNTTFTVNGLIPTEQVTIEVLALGQTACGPSIDTITCEALDCPDDVNLIVSRQENICLDANIPPVNLFDSLQITGSLSNPQISWSGEPGSTYVTTSGVFFPYSASFGQNRVTVTVTEDGCTFAETIFINVYPLPLSGFEAPAAVCINDTAELNALFVDTTATYYWNFDEATFLTGSNEGPIQIGYNGFSGTDTVTLSVEKDGCLSPPTEGYIEVQAPVPPPTINCNPTLDAIAFSWDSIPGVDDYQIDINYQAPGAVLDGQNDSGISFSNLMQNDSVTITVTAIDTQNLCGPSVSTLTCNALNCPPISLDIEQLSDSCLGEGATFSRQLNALIYNTSGNGLGRWSGTMVDSNGFFAVTQPGNYNVSYQHEEGGCTFNVSEALRVYPIPSADFSLDQSICETDSAILLYTGDPVSGAIYNWSIQNYSGLALSGAGPHTLSWVSPGLYDVSLQVEANGCSSPTELSQIRVDEALTAPAPICNATTTSVEICWTPDPIADDYTVTVASGFSGVRMGDCYRIENLSPDTTIVYTITAITNGACENISITDSCRTIPCPNIAVEMPPIDNICLDGTYPVMDLSDSINISPGGNGTLVWSGQGIEPDGLFDPENLGAGTYDLSAIYIESGCQYQSDFTLQVFNQPIAEAGPDQVLTCVDTLAELGLSSNLNNDPGVIFNWSGGTVTDENSGTTTTNTGGTYTITAVDTISGCTFSDDVLIDVSQEAPIMDLRSNDIRCAGEGNGSIHIENVQNGTPPYQFSMNGGNMTTQRDFENLSQGVYQLLVMDQNGCTDTSSITIDAPAPINLQLQLTGITNPINLGDSVRLTTILNLNPAEIESINWDPDYLNDCYNPDIEPCLQITDVPSENTLYRATVTDIHGCVAVYELPVTVQKIRNVFIPSAFSPGDNDGINDEFMIYGGNQIREVNSFMIFDRWGNLLHEYYNFEPSDTRHGWNGRYKGKPMDSGVYIYFAEIEFIDGGKEIFKGDITIK